MLSCLNYSLRFLLLICVQLSVMELFHYCGLVSIKIFKNVPYCRLFSQAEI